MRTATSELDLRSAATLDEALSILRDEPRMPVAGATDVYVALNFGTLTQRRLLDIRGLNELRGVSADDRVLSIGALASYSEIIASPEVRDRVPMLVAAARQIGGVQIQNRGTLGGNIANGSPAADAVPVLAAMDALVVLQSVAAERRVPLTGFYTGYRATVMRPDELIVRVEVPHAQGRQWFRKVGTRAAQAISKVVMAAVRSPEPRIAVGSVAATVVRLPNTERALANGANVDDAAQVLAAEIAPIDDVRSSADYRRTVAANLLRRFWRETA